MILTCADVAIDETLTTPATPAGGATATRVTNHSREEGHFHLKCAPAPNFSLNWGRRKRKNPRNTLVVASSVFAFKNQQHSRGRLCHTILSMRACIVAQFYFGAIRIAPSMRIVSPLIMLFSMMCCTNAAYSRG